MSTGVRELKLWQEAVALAGEVGRAVAQHARRETRAFTDRLLAAAAAVPVAIADAHGRATPADQRERLRAARLALAELETLLAIARHGTLLPPAAAAQLTPRLSAVARLLGGYLGYVERQTAADLLASAAATPDAPAWPRAEPDAAPSGTDASAPP